MVIAAPAVTKTLKCVQARFEFYHRSWTLKNPNSDPRSQVPCAVYFRARLYICISIFTFCDIKSVPPFFCGIFDLGVFILKNCQFYIVLFTKKLGLLSILNRIDFFFNLCASMSYCRIIRFYFYHLFYFILYKMLQKTSCINFVFAVSQVRDDGVFSNFSFT